MSEASSINEPACPMEERNDRSPKSVALPNECLTEIVEYLWKEMVTMHSLLVSNRSLFYITIPVLYRDPFKLIAMRRDLEPLEERMAHLIRLFWRCSKLFTKDQEQQRSGNTSMASAEFKDPQVSSLPVARAKPFLLADADEEFPYPTVDYLAFYSHQSLIERLWASKPYLFPAMSSKNRTRINQETTIVSWVLTTVFFEHRPSILRVLCMTPDQLGVILEQDDKDQKQGPIALLARLRCLELDMSPSKQSVDLTASWHLSPFEDMPPPITSDMDDMDAPLLFVRRHQGRHTNTLLEIVVRGSNPTWSPIDHLLAHVQPMHLVDLSAWNSPLSTLEQLPITELRVLRLNMPRRLDWAGVSPAFLQSCTKLREIWMPSQYPTYFRQPVSSQDTTMASVSQGAGNMTDSARQVKLRSGVRSHGTLVDLDTRGGHRGDMLEKACMPMRIIKLYGLHHNIVPNFIAALETCDQLTECHIEEDGIGPRADYIQLIQWHWRMEHLTVLSLRGRFVVFLDLSSLLHCPLLCTLRLVVETNLAPMAQNHVGILGEMKRLEEIQLRGTPWRLDNDTLLQLGQGLSHSLRYLDIMDTMNPSTRGLAEFTQVATRLEILKLGVPYLQVETRLRASVRSGVKVIISQES